MPKYELIDSENYFDVFVAVPFEKSLGTSDITQIVRLVLDLVQKAVDLTLTDGLVALRIEEPRLELQFRYSKVVPTHPKLALLAGEDLSRLRINFVFYLVAKIDSHYPLKETSLPSDFRSFLNFPDKLRDHLDLDGYF
jgi:hypothetical protein